MRTRRLFVPLVLLAIVVFGVAGVLAQGEALDDANRPAVSPDRPAVQPEPGSGYTPASPDQPAPRLIQWSPQTGEELALDAPLELVFDQPMNPASVEAAFSLQPETPGTFTWPDARSLRFTPATPWPRGSSYELLLSQEARSADGVPLGEPFRLRFSSVGFLTLSQVIPAPGTSDVDAAAAVITLVFNRPVVPLTTLEQQQDFPQPVEFSPAIAGKGEWVNTSVYVFTPAGPLQGGTTYQARVKAGLQDTTGGLLAEDYTWSFSTAPPKVVWTQPADGSNQVSVRPRIEVQFNMPVDAESARRSFRLEANGVPVPGEFEFVAQTLVFTPGQQLEFATTYQVRLAAGLLPAAGGERGMPQDYAFSFTTVPLPDIVRTEPADGARDANPRTALTIYFNTLIDPDTVMPHLRLDEKIKPSEVYTYYQYWDNGFRIHFGAQPSTEYAFEILPGIQDPFGNRIERGMQLSFRTAPLEPDFRLHVPDTVATYDAGQPARILVAYVNIKDIYFRLYRLDPGQLTLPDWEWGQLTPERSQLVRRWRLSVEAPLNQSRFARVDLVEGGGRLEPGLYLLTADSPQVPRERAGRGWNRHVLVVSDINLTLKSGPRDALVWATRLSDGTPVPGLNIRLYDQNSGRTSQPSVTDDQGVAYFTLSREPGSQLFAYSLDPFAAVSNRWARGTSAGDFGLPPAYGWNDLQVFMYTDRPIYRPAQTVNLKGIIRLENDASFSLARLDEVQVSIRDASYETVFEDRLAVSDNGTFSLSYPLAPGAPLGMYTVVATAMGRDFSSQFQVAAYRPPEFQVAVTPAAAETVAGQPVQATVEVTYFFGGAVAEAPVQWNVLSERYVFRPPWGGGYIFTDIDDPWFCLDCWWRPPTPPTPIASGSGVTDERGQLQISLPADLRDASGEPLRGSYRLIIEATVSGRDGQVISGRQSVIVHQGDFYVGLRTRQYLGQEGKPFSVDLVTVNWQGERLANKQVEVQVYRREWINQFVEAEGGGQWKWEQKDTLVETLSAVTDARGEASVTFTPPQAGSYRLTAQAKDDQGRLIRATTFIWVSGKQYVSWRRENNDRINLIADKSSYQPGETAEILIPSPYAQPHYALVSVERNHILRHEVIRLESNSAVYRLPIQPEDMPNIYVSVVLIKGSQADGQPADYKVGILPLQVSTQAKELKVTVSASQAKAEPGSQLDYQITVTDVQGRPVQAELSLDLVDKAVLSLQPRQPDALRQAFYAQRGLGIETAAALAISANRIQKEMEQDLGLPTAEQGELAEEVAPAPMATAQPMLAAAGREAKAGQPAPPAGVTLRQEFADTAYWNPQLTTDEQGRAQVSLKLPDNLTTWVMRGMAVNAQTQVGEGLNEVIATKPLLIRPITPRFLVAADEVLLGAAVSNNSDQALEVVVGLSSSGLTLGDAATQTLRLEAGREATVRWRATVGDAPYVDLVFSAQAEAAGYSDASKPRLATGPQGSLAVYRYSAPDIVGTAGMLSEAGSATELVVLPPKYDERRGELSLRVDPSLAAGMRAGLSYLEHYPYECAEQTVSRFLPNVLTYQAMRALGVDNPELAAKLPELVQQGLDKLYAQQHADGGWGWWQDDESNVHVTGYVVFAMLKARQADLAVRPEVLERGLVFLETHMRSPDELDTTWQANQQAWLLYVLAEAGRAPDWMLDGLFANRERLSLYARAYLALAVHLQQADADKINTLLSDFNNNAILSASGAHWEEAETDWWAMNSDTRTTAIILDALVRLDPQNALIPNVVRWLMVARKLEGMWSTTQETAWALIAFTDWMRYTGELQADYGYRVRLNDQVLGEGQVNAENVEQSQQLKVDVADLLKDQANRLVFQRTAGPGRLYYTAHLKVYLPVEQLKPVDRGIIVQRRYSLADCQLGSRCPEVREVKVGDVIRVDLTIIARHDLHYVIVEDMLPAGAEAIDAGLATTSLLAMQPQLRRQLPEGETMPWYWGWWHWYSRSELRDEKVVLFADFLAAGSYEYSYTMRATQAGSFHVIPAVASEFYFPEVFGRSEGRMLYIGQPE